VAYCGFVQADLTLSKPRIAGVAFIRLSPYRAVNTLRLSYTNQSVNVVQ
jgi:hypothetical protein